MPRSRLSWWPTVGNGQSERIWARTMRPRGGIRRGVRFRGGIRLPGLYRRFPTPRLRHELAGWGPCIVPLWSEEPRPDQSRGVRGHENKRVGRTSFWDSSPTTRGMASRRGGSLGSQIDLQCRVVCLRFCGLGHGRHLVPAMIRVVAAGDAVLARAKVGRLTERAMTREEVKGILRAPNTQPLARR